MSEDPAGELCGGLRNAHDRTHGVVRIVLAKVVLRSGLRCLSCAVVIAWSGARKSL
ncbi:hypothetical protein DUI70_0133 [Streptomyces albus]|nr:hypothetical protein DUI70_0133 [Streptomyces albus]